MSSPEFPQGFRRNFWPLKGGPGRALPGQERPRKEAAPPPPRKLTPEEEKRLKDLLDRGETTSDEVREVRDTLEQAHGVGWNLTLEEALARVNTKMDHANRLAAANDPVPEDIDPTDLKLLEKIGRGSQAVVYKCRHTPTGRILAVKILSAEAARDPQNRNRFVSEGRQAARLNHENLVRIYQVGPFKDTFFIAMEYVDGGSVNDLIVARKRIEPAEAVRIIRAAAMGLAYVHRRGFIHRDIKPKNILLTREGVAKIADLGLARRNADIDSAFEEIGKAYGTPYYISPEQVRGDPDTDHRTDIYSLGATFYEMLTGRPPFTTPDSRQFAKIMQMHVNKPVPDPRHFVPDLPESLCRILATALAKNPQDRYHRTDGFVHALDKTGLAGPPPGEEEK
ncbi:MAG: serine/threonine protein kinase [Planctomycetes bacterium]|nr:serine/threonine protein kinase [Planctomycetota bacterium]